MKKLMIAAAIVCAAVASQAATVTWSSESSAYVDAKGTRQKAMPTGQSIVLCVIGDTTGFVAGDWDGTVTKELATAKLKTSTTSKGRVSESFAFDFADNVLKNNDVLAVVIKNGSAYEQIAYYDTANGMVTDTLKVSGLDDDSWTQTLTFATKGSFTTAAVPEPTSAMLLVLGLGALALRRRRA